MTGDLLEQLQTFLKRTNFSCFEMPGKKPQMNAQMCEQELSFNLTFCRPPPELDREAADSNSSDEDSLPLL